LKLATFLYNFLGVVHLQCVDPLRRNTGCTYSAWQLPPVTSDRRNRACQIILSFNKTWFYSGI